MSRRIKFDSDNLISFFQDYNLGIFSENTTIQGECRKLHKKLYGLMVFRNELYEQKYSLSFLSQDFERYFDEMISDMLLSVFNWANGVYKSAKLELRCVIENLLKTLLCVANSDIIYEKRFFVIFEEAKHDTHFSTPIGTDLLLKLRNTYSLLCETVHSTPKGTVALNALNYLPKHDAKQSLEYVNIYSEILSNIQAILYLNFYAIVDNMHPENKQDYLDTLRPSEIKRITQYLFE